ncbi:MAG: helix-turn-helix domain-containing protein [Actinobacteria bacterium]|nr:helix-turn-helix domain-containing protein [Actinomycetota bacterium]
MGFSASYISSSVTASGVPLSRSALSQVENGKRRVTVDELVALAGALLCHPAALLGPEPPYPGTRLDSGAAVTTVTEQAMPIGRTKRRTIGTAHESPSVDDAADPDNEALARAITDAWAAYNDLSVRIDSAMSAMTRAKEGPPRKYGPTAEEFAAEVVQLHSEREAVRRRLDELSRQGEADRG